MLKQIGFLVVLTILAGCTSGCSTTGDMWGYHSDVGTFSGWKRMGYSDPSRKVDSSQIAAKAVEVDPEMAALIAIASKEEDPAKRQDLLRTIEKVSENRTSGYGGYGNNYSNSYGNSYGNVGGNRPASGMGPGQNLFSGAVINAFQDYDCDVWLNEKYLGRLAPREGKGQNWAFAYLPAGGPHKLRYRTIPGEVEKIEYFNVTAQTGRAQLDNGWRGDWKWSF